MVHPGRDLAGLDYYLHISSDSGTPSTFSSGQGHVVPSRNAGFIPESREDCLEPQSRGSRLGLDGI
jgi:hypothetical protein